MLLIVFYGRVVRLTLFAWAYFWWTVQHFRRHLGNEVFEELVARDWTFLSEFVKTFLCVAALFDSKDTGKSQALRMLTNHTSSSYPTCRQLFSLCCRMVQEPFIYFFNASPLSFSKILKNRFFIETPAILVYYNNTQICSHDNFSNLPIREYFSSM